MSQEQDKRPKYPGLGLPLRWEKEHQYGVEPAECTPLECYASAAGPGGFSAQSRLIQVRELAMMHIIDKLSDKPDWHKKVFDENIVAKWRKEALAIPNDEFYKLASVAKHQFRNEQGELRFSDGHRYAKEIPECIMSEDAFNFCISELRAKAKYFEKTGLIPTLDASYTIVKSDTLVSPELQTALRKAFDQLTSDQASSPDWHPRTDEMVRDLVHPSMYPLVYGRSLVFREENVGVHDAIHKWAGKGEVIPEYEQSTDYNPQYPSYNHEYFSEKYQWLPANMEFRYDGGVQFTSYINNLHPNKYPEIYKTIEELVKISLPAWDQCLALLRDFGEPDGAGRMGNRIPDSNNPDDENEDNWTPRPEECQNFEYNESEIEEIEEESGMDINDIDDPEELLRYQWQLVRRPKLPEPTFTDTEYTPKFENNLIERYHKTGLQVIVKLASIELTPEKPEFPVGGWHVEGQMNERICATALYYLDSENVTPSSLSFRMSTDSDLAADDMWAVGQEQYHWLESVYAVDLSPGGDPCLQNYGSVETREGRLLAFPNGFQHRVSPFRLADPTKPGHRRFVALWLVDPTRRIISTANVPPQQMSWFTDSIFGTDALVSADALSKLPAELIALLQEKGAALPDADLSEKSEKSDGIKLPAELMEMVRAHLSANGSKMCMSEEEARQHREKLMDERTRYANMAKDEWQSGSYSFCEH